MKDLLVGILATAAIILVCSSVETVWTPMSKTDGRGTQEIGESDLVLPGGGDALVTTQEITMTDAEKLASIDAFLDDAFKYYGDLDDSAVWKGVAIVISDIVKFGGVIID